MLTSLRCCRRDEARRMAAWWDMAGWQRPLGWQPSARTPANTESQDIFPANQDITGTQVWMEFDHFREIMGA